MKNEQSTSLVEQFVTEILKKGTYHELDRRYLINRIYAMVGEQPLEKVTAVNDLLQLQDALIETAIQNHKIEDNPTDREILGADLMNFMTPTPYEVNTKFWDLYQKSPQTATAYFYQLSRDNDYIKTRAIAKNIEFPVPTNYGNLEITINLSKPEKDPRAIALAQKTVSTSYPQCQLCLENEGYEGRVGHPARGNHRIVRLQLDGETWGFQYSPYAYFAEHCIFISEVHRPMHIDRTTFQNLVAITKLFPDYFVGSNADLPIVGGSILSHDHYQGGKHEFPMAVAAIAKPFELNGFVNVSAGTVKWPMSVIRLKSGSESALVSAATKILKVWQNYDDPKRDIRHETNGEKHHTITPIVRQRAGRFEMDLVLRDNQTSKQYPDGIFHPHQDVQHIKKENIGLIEVMGRAILPARLKAELLEVQRYLLKQSNEMKPYHKKWADQLQEKYQFTADNVQEIVDQEVGRVFLRVLEDAGVFKQTTDGQTGFMKFIHKVNEV
ncbi:UDP-glucose--hexose-1-phosphate uridylyltransferase [Pediococcus ethanolidurans]|uniref:UDP-glucose--hexose-1-phosphate uridylyltransferase n=1 Tax=Pediococcus ethanolidurans TaxID=319653 RepID=UPI0021AAD2FF|nr:UDP-glucose--hexose-1-phosphate uridylyltransferase [Pediococcus ethanolidurans]MCT4398506.1 UDP-glucose--hexose-1-phosphate uridylyltransferase [Pediococcus ethanolidurans]